MSGKVTRRRFLKGLAAVAGGTALAACAPQIVKETVIVEKAVKEIVKETVVVEKAVEQRVIETVVVEKEVAVDRKVVETVIVTEERVVEKEKVVTATPIPLNLAGELRLMHWWGTAFSEGSDTIKVYEDKTGVKVLEEPSPAGGVPKIMTMLAAGTAADAFMVDAPANGLYYPKDVLLPVEDFFDQFGVEVNKFPFDPYFENGYMGHVMGLSLFPMQTVVLFLNKEKADETGMDLPVWGDSNSAALDTFDTWHWADLLEFAKLGTKKTSDGTIEQYGIDAWGGNPARTPTWNKDRILELGGNVFDEGMWYYDEKECIINSPEAVQALQDFLDLTEKYELGPRDEFASGIEGGIFRAGMSMATIGYSGAHIYPPDDLPFEQAYMMMPWDNKRIQMVGANYFSVNRRSENKDAAIAWAIMAATDFDMVEELMPFALAAYETQAHMDLVEPGPYKEGYQLWIARSESMGMCAHCKGNVDFYPRWAGGRVQGIFGENFNIELGRAILGEVSMQEAMDTVKRVVDEAILEA